MRILGIVALGAALCGCASSSSDIPPAYISPVFYQSYNCQQLGLEAQSVSARAAALSGVQDRQHTRDALLGTAGFFDAAGNGGLGVGISNAITGSMGSNADEQRRAQTAAELAQMKGQMVAVEQALIAKNCGDQFQAQRPPAT
jgi:hypothetical protein